MNKMWGKFEEKINDFSIRKKLILFYFCCVLLPLFVTDGMLLGILYIGEIKEKNTEMKNIASAVEAELTYTFGEAEKMANAIYIKRSVSEFLEKQYDSGLQFYEAGREMKMRDFYEMGSGMDIVMFADNETIVNGDYFYRLSAIKDEEWYQKQQESGKDMTVSFYYIGDQKPSASVSRKISVVRMLDYYKDLKCEKILRIDLDYSMLSKKIVDMQYSLPVYVCQGDRIILSNIGNAGAKMDFEYLTGEEKIGYSRESSICGETIRILVMETESDLFSIIKQHMPMIALLVIINVLLPFTMALIFNRTIVTRLTQLSNAFDEVKAESLKEIENVSGKDEIGSLMHNYNRMVKKSRELIKIVYKDQMEKQKMDIARQNAELLALHSQIDPHFLFNVLEGIRMHSIIKGEEETAEMIERLAILERQNVDWKRDIIKIEEELTFVESYLKLQNYRFGERMLYQIEAEQDCYEYLLPKLTLATFVENACVHGVEKKAVPCRVYVRVYSRDGWLYLEVEDTGAGMNNDEVARLKENMLVSNIEALRHNEHVGVANACLRLKMVTEGKAEFELESEQEVGTLVVIKVPVACLKENEETEKRCN